MTSGCERSWFTWIPRRDPRIQDWISRKSSEDWIWDHNEPPRRNDDGSFAYQFFPRNPQW